MICLSCARTGTEQPAVALCPHCKAGLCLLHVAETTLSNGPGGTLFSCGHHTWDSAWQHDVPGR